MFKHFVTLLRGAAHDTARGALDQNALRLLDQQIRDGRGRVAAAKQALAVAMAQAARETRALQAAADQIADLEARARAALAKGEAGLAREAAEAIASLEAEQEASRRAQEAFEVEVGRLKRVLRQGETRLRELERGRRVAAAKDKAQRLGDAGGPGAPGAASLAQATLGEAEETLQRLRDRQDERDQADEALHALDAQSTGESLTTRLSDAGCGPPQRPRAEDVLARLKAESAAEGAPRDGARDDASSA